MDKTPPGLEALRSEIQVRYIWIKLASSSLEKEEVSPVAWIALKTFPLTFCFKGR